VILALHSPFQKVRNANFVLNLAFGISQLENREASEPEVYENRKGNRSARVHLNVESKIDPFASIVANLYAPGAQSYCPWYLCANPVFNACAMQKYMVIRNERKWYLQCAPAA
jgi:hypothetical protein